MLSEKWQVNMKIYKVNNQQHDSKQVHITYIPIQCL